MTAVANTAVHAPSKALHIGLWVVQGLLAAAFLAIGVTKTSTPIDQLASKMPWVTTAPEAFVRFVGTVELAGALGLVLPSVTRIKPWLTPLAAAGLAIMMIFAAGLHVFRGETEVLPVNLIFGVLAAFVAWGRSGRARIPSR